MKEVERRSPLSRSLLERQFRRYLGRSPQAEIRAVQLKRVKQLLAESDLALDKIAALAGYSHPEYMSVVFKRETGQTPGQYRMLANPAFSVSQRASETSTPRSAQGNLRSTSAATFVPPAPRLAARAFPMDGL
jgi:AraC-like DNA-binding protein